MDNNEPPPFVFAHTYPGNDMLHILPEARIVLDCGAHRGETLDSVRRVYPRAEVYCFEPASEPYQVLLGQCEKLGGHAVKKAVGNINGTAILNLTASSACNSLFGFQAGNPCAELTAVVAQEEVEVCTLDQWCKDADVDPESVDLLKLDVQGAEIEALEGAKRLLTSVKLVFLEVCFVEFYAGAPLWGDIDSFMAESGYGRYGVYRSPCPELWADALYVRG